MNGSLKFRPGEKTSTTWPNCFTTATEPASTCVKESEMAMPTKISSATTTPEITADLRLAFPRRPVAAAIKNATTTPNATATNRVVVRAPM